jgi:hypothetical protein
MEGAVVRRKGIDGSREDERDPGTDGVAERFARGMRRGLIRPSVMTACLRPENGRTPDVDADMPAPSVTKLTSPGAARPHADSQTEDEKNADLFHHD